MGLPYVPCVKDGDGNCACKPGYIMEAVENPLHLDLSKRPAELNEKDEKAKKDYMVLQDRVRSYMSFVLQLDSASSSSWWRANDDREGGTTSQTMGRSNSILSVD